jgi:GDP-L-fucose synthase
MKVLVAGGTGFVGRHVIETLRKADIATVSASRREGTDLRDVAQACELIRRERPDVVINCAAHVGSLNYVTRQAADIVVDNTAMAIGLYGAIAKESPDTVVVNPIANCAYPATATTFEEDHWWDGPLHRSVLSYGSTRRTLWAMGECFRMQHGIRSVSFLVPNMYGPYDSTDPDKAHALNALISKFVKARRSGTKEVEVWGTGIPVREWLYAGDFAKVVLRVIQNPPTAGLDEALNVGQNFGLSVRELVNLIVKAMQFEGNVRFNHNMPDGAPRKVMDDRRFRKTFPDFAFTSLEQGIAATVRYYDQIYPY